MGLRVKFRVKIVLFTLTNPVLIYNNKLYTLDTKMPIRIPFSTCTSLVIGKKIYSDISIFFSNTLVGRSYYCHDNIIMCA